MHVCNAEGVSRVIMCYDRNMTCDSKQPIKGGHCYVMLNGLWTVLYSIPYVFGGHPTHFTMSVQCN